MEGGEVVFYATSFQDINAGLYRHTAAAGIVPVVTPNTPVPGGTGNFQPFFSSNELPLSGGKMAFIGADPNGMSGIFLQSGQAIEKNVMGGDTLNGTQVFSFELFRDGFAGNELLFMADRTLYRAQLGGTVVPAPVSLQISRNGDLLEITWDGAAAGSSARLESTPSLSLPDWPPVSAPSNPF